VSDLEQERWAKLAASIAAFRGVTETELHNLNKRLSNVERRQEDLAHVATQGRTALRILLWLGGAAAAAVTLVAKFWDGF
jgi:hypothetical protein